MNKSVQHEEVARGPSKYAKKRADEDAGKREPFAFGGKSPETSSSSTPKGLMRAVVNEIALTKGFLFLLDKDGRTIFLGLSLLRRDYNGEIARRYVVECETEYNPNGKGLRVTRIHSVSSPQRT